VASEWRYRDPIVGPDTLVIALSQSGETADTLAALRLARANGDSGHQRARQPDDS
jgi:glucosamine--fructose-6-phosphate aminotransferase (isomerizing)